MAEAFARAAAAADVARAAARAEAAVARFAQLARAAALAAENHAPVPGSSVLAGAVTAEMSAVGAAERAAPFHLRRASLLLGVAIAVIDGCVSSHDRWPSAWGAALRRTLEITTEGSANF